MRQLIVLALFVLLCPAPAGAQHLERKLSPELRAWDAGPAAAPAGPVTLRAMLVRGADASGPLTSLRALLPAGSRAVAPVRDLAGREVVWLDLPGTRAAAVAQRLAAMDQVAYVERWRMPVPANDATSWLIQSGDETEGRTIWAHGLTGIGQVVGVADTGLDADACQFRFSADPQAVTRAIDAPQPPEAVADRPNNKVITYYLLGNAEAYDSSASHFHGTHSSGNAVGDDYQHLAGADEDPYDLHDGMAPGAQLVFQDIGTNDGYLVGLNRASMYDMLHQAYATGARIHSNSYGLVDPQPAYDIDAASIDEAVWDHNDLVVLFSAGNGGPEPMTLNGMGSVAKNSLSVGASGPVALDVFGSILDLAEELLFFSSQGPTADGRIKPDLVAPGMTFSATSDPDAAEYLGCCDRDGNEMWAAAVDDDNCNVDEDWPATGTSFSCPVTAGAAALVRQYFVDGYWRTGRAAASDGFSPTSALVKACLVNGAAPLAGEVFMSDATLAPPPAPGQGWGRVDLERVLWFDGDQRHLLVLDDVPNPVPGDPMATAAPPAWPHAGVALTTGDERAFELPAVEAGAQVAVHLVWNDPPATPGAERILVNDLDLEVIAPDGERWMGNRGFGSEGLAVPVDTDPDSVNNVEGVVFAAPDPGRYSVRVVAADVPGNELPGSDAQGYALVASGPFLPPVAEALSPARVSPGKELEDLELTGSGFVEGLELDLGPGVSVEGLEVVAPDRAVIGRISVDPDAERGWRPGRVRTHRSLASETQALLEVARPGCACGSGEPRRPLGWLAVLGLIGFLALSRRSFSAG